jgi:hypothetical protein
MESILMAFCGLDCRECPVFVATAKDDDVARQKVAQEWTPIALEHWTKEPLKASDMNCRGCKSDLIFLGCRLCPMRNCSSGKGYDHCGQCAELDTCGKVKGLHAEFPQALVNLRQAG